MTLTPRKIQIVKAIALGKCRKEIAADLGINVKTIDLHLNGDPSRERGILHRLGFSDPARLTHWAIVHHLVKLGEPLTDINV